MDLAPIDDAASKFGISRDTVYRLVRKHQLEIYRRTGDRRSYVDQDALRPFLDFQPTSSSQPRRPSPRR